MHSMHQSTMVCPTLHDRTVWSMTRTHLIHRLPKEPAEELKIGEVVGIEVTSC